MAETLKYPEGLDGSWVNQEQYVTLKNRALNLKKPVGGGFEPLLSAIEVKVVTDYAYHVFEYLEMNGYRSGVDYSQVKAFAKKYRVLMDYILDIGPVRQKMAFWLKENVDMAEMAMYAGVTNSLNKHMYH